MAAKILAFDENARRALERGVDQLADTVKENPEMAVVVGLLAGQLGDYAEADQYFKQALEHGYKEPEQLYR